MSKPSPSDSKGIFLSYSRNDRTAAIALRDALLEADLAVFRDEDTIRVGDGWMARLQDALKACPAFIVLVGRDGVRRWIGAEVEIALNRHFGPRDDADRLPIFPILLDEADPAALPPFLASMQSTQWTGTGPLPDGFVDAVRAKTQLVAQPEPFEGNPFLALRAFRKSDDRLFFGRRRETLEAISVLGDQQGGNPETLRDGPRFVRWLQIEGNSGSGKSSLVQAGLLPLVDRGALWARTGLDQWTVIGPMIPGADPVTNLATVLEETFVPDKALRRIDERRDRLRKSDDALALMLREQKEPDTAFLLVVDQFEELFTSAADDPRKRFDALLALAVQDRDCPLFVISTVRADFLDRFERLPALQRIYNDRCKRYFLPTVTEESLKEIIEGPAKLADLDASQITEVILRDARDEPGALPLVENALDRLWEKRQGNRLLGDVYRDEGGMAGMLSAGADALLAELDREVPGGELGAFELFLRLTRIQDDGRHTRRRISQQEAAYVAGRRNPKRGEHVVRRLSGEGEAATKGNLRLITTITEGEDGSRFVDLIHETLVRARTTEASPDKPVPYWPKLYEYLARNRDRDMLRQQLEYDTGVWRRSGVLGHWWHLAGIPRLLRYRRLLTPKGSGEGRFLFWSRCCTLLHTAMIITVAGVLGESAWWANEQNFPFVYVILKPLWWLGYVPEPEMVRIPPTGRPTQFVMGCKGGRDAPAGRCPEGTTPAHPVTIGSPFYMGRYEVTFEQYDAYVWDQRRHGERVTYPPDLGMGRFGHPVIGISWEDTQAYLQWLNGRRPGKTYRLPTEREWEYAARGGLDSAYPWEGPFDANKTNCGTVRGTKHIGIHPANPWGLYDTAGNVSEWVADPYMSYPETTAQDSMTDSRVAHVVRGGSWLSLLEGCRVAYRSADHSFNTNDTGFRLCHSSPTE